MIQITAFPSQVRVEEYLTISGTAQGLEGRPLTLTFDDRFPTGAGSVSASGTWSVRFRFTQAGNRKLIFSATNAQGTVIRSQPIFINVVTTPLPPQVEIEIVAYPAEIRARETFTVAGTASNAAGKTVILTVDNQFRVGNSKVATDGTWQSDFQFLQPGTRRMTAAIAEGSEPAISNTVTIKVLPASPRLSITPPTQPVRAREGFVLQGGAKNFDNGEQLVIRVDRKYVLARPTVQNQQWQANLFFNQAGDRLIEVISSDQERTQIELDIQEAQPLVPILPYTLWTSEPTPDSIPDLINPKRITLHHTVIAALPETATQAQEVQRMRQILNIHLNSSGYSDIGYHYIIMPSGRIYEGRSSLKKGAHDLINDGFGVAVDGDFQNLRRITQKQFEAIVSLCALLCKRMGITDPVTPVSTQTYDFGLRSLPRILGHRDRVATACPGTVYERLGEIRQAVKQAL